MASDPVKMILMKNIVGLITILLLSLTVNAQTASPTPATVGEVKPKSDLMYKVLDSELTASLCSLSPNHAKCIGRDPVREMSDAYLEIIRTDPVQSKQLIARAAEKGAIYMQLVIVAQNQRIIELLEELVKKKP